MLRLGDILVFKGHGLVYEILSRLLKLFERDWDRWGWHTAFVSHIDPSMGTVSITESRGSGIHYVPLKANDYRVYKWFDREPDETVLWEFTLRYLYADYDVACYFWTGLQYLILHLFNHTIPRVLNERFNCWELVFQMCREMGKPIQSLHKYPMITDLLSAMEDSDVKRKQDEP